MFCLYCNREFTIAPGSKAHNRKMCYDCIPEGLSKLDRDKIYRTLIKKKIDDQKISLGCYRCGYNKCAAALEWHHPNDDKLVNPADCLKSNGFAGYVQYVEETSKCELLCANCHREEHSKD